VNMYNEFFGLQRSPFNLTPDPEFLYLNARHREALAGISYAILARKGFVVLTGDAGTGKTTLLTRILGHLPTTRIQSSVIVNPTLTPQEFLEAALLDFGFGNVPTSKAQRITMFQDFLWKGNREGKISALVIDEAHKLSLEVLEEIRLLGNFECGGEKLLQIVLVGQSELDELLNREHLNQLKQRIALRLMIEPLPAAEVERYIRHRWIKAGGNEPPFTKDAVACVTQVSKGIPRIVNVISDNALLQAFGENAVRVEARHVICVCRDLRLAMATNRRSAVEEPAPAAPVETALVVPAASDGTMKTLERYSGLANKRSLISRLAGKLGFMQRMETV
jgi:general secretion pathway protein A